MLTQINLKNYAIIDILNLNFSKGLNIITGETGTGKSIIVDAVNIILGDRAGIEVIRSGCDQAVIEAVFDVSGKDEIVSLLDSRGITVHDNELVIRRIVPREGRGRVFINDSVSTLKLLEEVTEDLIDIFSQHEHQSLLKERSHIRYLDMYMDNDELKNEYRRKYEEYRESADRLERLRSSAGQQLEKEDLLKYQLNELFILNPQPDEDKVLEQEARILSNSEEIAETVNEANRIIYEGDDSVYVSLNRILKKINNISHLDKALSDIGKGLNETIITLEDTTQSIRSYSESINHNPGRLDDISARLAELNKMKKKYNTDVAGLIKKIEEIDTSIKGIENVDEEIRKTQSRCEELKRDTEKLSEELSSKRREAASELSNRFQKEAAYVGLKDSSFKVELSEKELGPEGADGVKFLFSANPGEPAKELSKVASGGELSRVMLLIKELLTRSGHGSILIFDEADSGIGGAVAEAIGRKIKLLSENNQVLCITHLPQVAKFADTHYVVNKRSDKNRTTVSVQILDKDSRIREIGRMLAGETITDKTLEAAREMLSNR